MLADAGVAGLLYLLGFIVPLAVICGVVERVRPSRRKVKWPLGRMPVKCFAITIVWGLLYLVFIAATGP